MVLLHYKIYHVVRLKNNKELGTNILFQHTRHSFLFVVYFLKDSRVDKTVRVLTSLNNLGGISERLLNEQNVNINITS